MNRQVARDRWQALTEGSHPRLPMKFFQVAGTFLDSTEPEILAPSEKMFGLLERHVGDHLPQLATVTLAGLTSASADEVYKVLTTLEQFLSEVAGLVNGRVVPGVHYRKAFLKVRLAVSTARWLPRSYTKALQ